MPELPEVETVRQGLHQHTLGWSIAGGDVLLDRTIAFPETSAEFLHGLAGRTFSAWERRGKYLIARFAEGGGLGIHLRMTGQLLWCDPALPVGKHARVRLFLRRDRSIARRELRFDDRRTFGEMWWIPPDASDGQVIAGLQRLGPEPFDGSFTAAYLGDRLRHSSRPIKNALLDQAVVAGIGNIYADEALFRSGLHPQTPAHCLTLSQLERLRAAIVQVLEAGMACGGTTFSTFQDIAGDRGNYIQSAWVFRRTGQPCRVCRTAIARMVLAGRSSHFCPTCQPLQG